MKKEKAKTDFSCLKKDPMADFDIAIKSFESLCMSFNEAKLKNLPDQDWEQVNAAGRVVLDANEKVKQHIHAMYTLFTAIDEGKTSVVRQALDQGVDPNLENRGGYTMISCATAGGKEKIVDLLLAHKADPSLKQEDVFSAVEHAVIRDNVRIFNKFARAGVVMDKDAIKSIATQYQAEKILKKLSR
jgi:ankyrin repeat protein